MIKPSSNPGAPTVGARSVGELYVGSNGVLYFCVKSGTPGTWKTVKLDGGFGYKCASIRSQSRHYGFGSN